MREIAHTQPIKHLKMHSDAHDREKLLFLFIYASTTTLAQQLGRTMKV